MVAIAVDDESISLDCLEIVLQSTNEFSEIYKFSNAEDTLEWSKNNTADIAFLDIEMWKINGLQLAAALRKINPSCKIIFTTSNPKYAVEAFQLHANGYIVKPVTKEAVLKEINFIKENTIQAAETKSKNDTKPYVICFGNFDLFYQDKPIKFSRAKAKELFAYLVLKRGGSCSVAELAAVLFEDKEDSLSLQSQLRNLVSSLKTTLESINCVDILVKSRGFLAVNTNLFECDYYRFLNHDPSAINSYCGEFMSQYSWAEFTIGYLEKKLND